jgi:deoxyguanosine kinase
MIKKRFHGFIHKLRFEQSLTPISFTLPFFIDGSNIHMNYHFVTIEGNIGAGKTTLAHLLSKHYNARLILEEFADNPFLPKFYENPDQYAFPLELFFLAERFKQLKEFLQQKDMFQQLTISDYLFTKCLLFAKVTLPEDEFRLYQRLFDIIHQQLIQPDLLIYLHAPVSKLQANIKKRNRSYEQKIPDEYLFNIQETYTNYIKQHNIKTLFIDASNADFLGNEKQLKTIIEALDHDYDEGQHFISLP